MKQPKADKEAKKNRPVNGTMPEKEFLEEIFIPCLRAQIAMAKRRLKQLKNEEGRTPNG